MLYRKCGETTKAIPLSCQRHWGISKELKRFRTVHPYYIFPPNRKHCGNPYKELIAPRALGDVFVKSLESPSCPLIHKCKITVQDIRRGDVVVIGSVGFSAYWEDEKVIQILDQGKDKSSVERAKQLIQETVKQPDLPMRDSSVYVVDIK